MKKHSNADYRTAVDVAVAMCLLGGSASAESQGDDNRMTKQATPAGRPNIVLMVSDGHGREALGCYGKGVFGACSIDAFIHRPRFELYDLKAAPDEVENLDERSEYSELVASFCKKLRYVDSRSVRRPPRGPHPQPNRSGWSGSTGARAG